MNKGKHNVELREHNTFLRGLASTPMITHSQAKTSYAKIEFYSRKNICLLINCVTHPDDNINGGILLKALSLQSQEKFWIK